MPFAELHYALPIKVGYTTGNEQRRTEHHAPAPRVGVVNYRQPCEHQRHSKREPRPTPVVKHKHEKREQHVKQENNTKKPAHTDYMNLC